AQFFTNDDKEYRATMLLGVRTDTFDIEGEVLERRTPCLQPQEIRDVMGGFVGRIEQKAPRYSAVKFKGKPLYKWTRQGIDIEPPVRSVDVHHITVEEIRLPFVTFTVSCSKGTYIRSLCADIGDALGCGACLSSLRRTRSGSFEEENAISLECLADGEAIGILKKSLIPVANALPGFRNIVVDQDTANRIRQGYQPDCGVLNDKKTPLMEKGDLVKFMMQDGSIIAVAKTLFSAEEVSQLSEGKQVAKILRVFN
ncbi:MAG TPA: tRNA pseudouridine(55) synthase TruB, partial [Syntrophales bacterium]|nr:tRNA pseudouridine(55) synthase TruB [Syntrophales bacterium]